MKLRFALMLAFLPPAASASLACNCPDEGSDIEIATSSLPKKPVITVTAGDASLQCVERTDQNQCYSFWIVPHAAGNVTVTATFADGTSASDTIEYIHDGHYPCRGDLRPIHDHITHF